MKSSQCRGTQQGADPSETLPAGCHLHHLEKSAVNTTVTDRDMHLFSTPWTLPVICGTFFVAINALIHIAAAKMYTKKLPFPHSRLTRPLSAYGH
jgi:hypothetical protein